MSELKYTNLSIIYWGWLFISDGEKASDISDKSSDKYSY